MTLHHWWFGTIDGHHCQECPCKFGYSEVGRETERHYRCKWVHPPKFELLEATKFLLTELIGI